MKYIKAYEDMNDIQFNNYVVLQDNMFKGSLKDKIGRIVRLCNDKWRGEWFDIKYEDPKETVRITTGIIPDAIKYSAKTKEEIEAILAANKYNL